MESVTKIKEELSARSRTATLDQLASEGRKRVRLVRAEHIAQMISEAVHSAVEQSGLLDQQEVDRLVEQSRSEFKGVLAERQQEQAAHSELTARCAEQETQLEANEEQLAALRAQCQELTESLARRQAQLTELQRELEAAEAEAQQAQADRASQSAESQSAESQSAESAAAPAEAPATGTQPAMTAELMMSMMQELATLKASMATGGGAAAAQPAAAQDFTAALDKLAGTLNDRLDSIGKKVGISAAVGGDAPVDFGGLFKDDGDESVESNMENIQVKQQSGGGIAANLAKLKKLKGGG